jgi:hypothetical protein
MTGILALPCPFCGSNRVKIIEGSSFRWRVAQCDECGAQCGEVRIQTLGSGTKEQWEEEARGVVIKEWNSRVAEAGLRCPPREPTQDMCDAGRAELVDVPIDKVMSAGPSLLWRAMHDEWLNEGGQDAAAGNGADAEKRGSTPVPPSPDAASE